MHLVVQISVSKEEDQLARVEAKQLDPALKVMTNSLPHIAVSDHCQLLHLGAGNVLDVPCLLVC